MAPSITEAAKEASTAPLAWEDVRLFLALVRAKTLRDAGAALGMDTSTVSRRLVALEALVGARLFDRGREGIAPTSAAEALVEAAEDAEGAVLRFAQRAGGVERDVSGTVRLACPPGIADVFVAPRLRELLDQHAELSVVLVVGIAVVDLTRREADVAVRTVRPTRGDLVVKRLRATPWKLLGARSLVRRLGALETLADVPFVGWAEATGGFHGARWLTKHGREARVRLRSDAFAVQLAAARSGLGLVLAPEPYAAPGDLDVVQTTPALAAAVAELPVDELFLLTHKALRDVPRVEVVWDFAATILGETVPPKPRGRGPAALASIEVTAGSSRRAR